MLGIKELVVYGDSLLVIREVQKVAKNYKTHSTKMHHIFNNLVSEFKAISFLHILWTNNQSADQMARKGVNLDCGFITCNGNNPERCWVLWFRLKIFRFHYYIHFLGQLQQIYVMYSFCILILGEFVRFYNHSRLVLFQDKIHYVTKEHEDMVFEFSGFSPCFSSCNSFPFFLI